MTDKAEKIYGNVLDALTACLQAGDAKGCQTYLAIPFKMYLLDRTHVCTTRADIEEVVINYSAKMAEQGVTELRRTVEAARFLSPDKIEGFHITAPLRYERAVADPYAIRSVLVRQSHGWVSTEQEVIMHDGDWAVLPKRPSGRRKTQDKAGTRSAHEATL